MPRPRKSTAARFRVTLEFQTPNKKPLANAKGYGFCATGAPRSASVAEPNTPATEVLSHEFCS